MELIERPNLRAIHYLNSIQYDAFATDCIDQAKRDGDKPPKKDDIKVWYSVLRKYIYSALKTKGYTKRIYTHSSKTPTGLGGRFFSGNSLQGIWGVYRGLLMRGIATDIDMANAHPVILRYICRRHNIDCPFLEYYINNRDRCLAEFPNRNIGKKAYLVATNMDKVSRDSKLPQNFKNYDKEMKRIQKTIIELPDYQALYDTIPEYKASQNYNGCAMNRVLCYYENIILQHAIHHVNTLGIEIAILMFDGMMIYGNHYANLELLAGITQYVASQMPDLNMTWTYKPCDDTLHVPDDFDETEYETLNALRFATDDTQAGEMILTDLTGLLMVDISGRIYYKNENIWVCDIEEIKTYILNRICKSHICRANEENKYIPYSQNMKSARAILDAVLNQLKNSPRVDMRDLFHSTTLGRVCFLDGVLDFPQKKFYKWDEVNFPYYTCVCVYRNFADYKPDRHLIDYIRNTIFTPLYNEHIDQALNFFARGIAGYVGDKIWMSHTTNRHGGKSTTNVAFESAFGKQYVKPFSLSNISYSKMRIEKTSLSCYWALDYEYARLALSQEVSNPSDNVKVDGALLKKITSGADTFSARRNFDRHDTEFKTQITLGIFGNYTLVSDSRDVWDTCFEVHSHNTYYTQVEIDKMREDGTDERILKYIHLRDATMISSFSSNDDWKNAVVWMLLEAFTPNPTRPTKVDEIDDDTASISKKVLETYDITNHPDDIVLCSDLHTLIGECKKNTLKELEKLGVKKIRSKSRGVLRDKIVYSGIKLKETEIDEGNL